MSYLIVMELLFLIDFNNINLDNTNYAKDDPDPIIVVKLLGWHIKFEKCKALKKRSVKN